MGKIEVAERIGLDLILPLAAMLPSERHIDWTQAQQLPGRVAENLLGGLGPLVDVLFARLSRLPGPLGWFFGTAGPSLQLASQLARDRLKEMNDEAREKGDNLKATLTGFQLDLDRGEERRISSGAAGEPHLGDARVELGLPVPPRRRVRRSASRL